MSSRKHGLWVIRRKVLIETFFTIIKRWYLQTVCSFKSPPTQSPKPLVLIALRLIIFIFASSLMFNCGQSDNNENSIPHLDTTEIISKANIKESVSSIPDSLVGKLDSIHVKFISFACDCPDFVVESSKGKNGQYSTSYYVEPASPKDSIPEILLYSSNEFIFYGQVINESDFPSNSKFQDPKPTPGHVFKYWYYRIKRPYNFWGPKYKIQNDVDFTELTSVIHVQ